MKGPAVSQGLFFVDRSESYLYLEETESSL